MATLTIRGLDETLKLRLRLRAAGQSHSMEEEARQILRSALQETAADPGHSSPRSRRSRGGAARAS